MADYSNLANLLQGNVKCFIFDSIPNTNNYLIKMPFSKKVIVCITKEQTHGRGQRNRRWLVRKNGSVVFSIRLNIADNIPLNGLSLVVGMAVIKVLEQNYNIKQLQLKWPNDVYVYDKKLSGILIENKIQKNNQAVVIGLGLNNNLGNNFKCETPWIDLNSILQTTPEIVNLSAKLINKIIKYCRIFELKGLNAFNKEWATHDYLFNKTVNISYKNKQIIGVAKGINNKGALYLKCKNSIEEIYSYETLIII